MSQDLELLAGTRAGFLDGAALSAFLDQPTCVSLAPNGNIWIVDRGNVRIRSLDDETLVTSLTGTRASPFQVQNSFGAVEAVSAATFHVPCHVAHGRNGEAFVVDSTGSRVRKMVAGAVYTVVESVLKSYSEGWDRSLLSPHAVRVDHLGDVWIANTGKKEILHVRNVGDTLATGKSLLSWKNGEIFESSWVEPFDVAFSPLDLTKVYVADGCTIKVLNRFTKEVVWYAGTVEPGYVDGWRATASFGSCDFLLACPNGDLLISDTTNRVIRRISMLGMVSTFVGPTGRTVIPTLPTAPLQPFPIDNKLKKPFPAPSDTEPTFEGHFYEIGSCCFNRNGDLIIPDSTAHRIYTIRMASVPSNVRFQLDKVERASSFSSNTIKTKATRLLTHKSSNTSWNIIDATLALATSQLAHLQEVITYLEDTVECSPDSIEILLNMLSGVSPTIDSSENAVGVIRCLVDLKLVEVLHENRYVLSQVLIKDVREDKLVRNLVKESRTGAAVIDRMLGTFDTNKPSMSPSLMPYFDQPYNSAGLLRAQVERLYWSTVWNGFPALPSDAKAGPTLPKENCYGEDVPDCLKPNLEITTIDGAVSCHDWVLVSRWKFVRHMFMFAGEETHSRQVSLEEVGITSQALRYILYFMYTDRVDLLDDEHLRLSIHKWSAELYLTDFEDVALPGCERLIKHTSKSFAQPLTLENAVPTYRAAVEGGSPAHEQRALKFIAQKLSQMMESDRRHAELQTLEPHVLAQIMFLHYGRAYQGSKPNGDSEKAS